MKKPTSNRRNFIKKAVGTSLLAGAAPSLLLAGKSKQSFEIKAPEREPRKYGPNDQVNIAVIGMGIMGFNNLATSVKIPGVKLVAACDLYDGRLGRTKELYGNDIFTTRDYKEILDRKDVDAVIIATTDHWHDKISIDAMNKGKHVYCEKPMVHRLDEGQAVIDTQAKTKMVFQVGSQSASNLVSHKAKEIYESGAIGQLVLVETYNDRQGGSGAWQYSIPTDASPRTVDWERYLGDAPKIPFDAKRFFRWRNYQDYGTGIAGDLFVHLFTNFHTITGSTGPNRIYASGGLRYWNDGRDVPDVMCSIHDYPATAKHPAFNLQMRVNFVDGGGGGSRVRLVGSEGTITLGWSGLTVQQNKTKKAPGYGGWDSFNTFTEAQQKEFEKWYKAEFPPEKPEMQVPEVEYRAPQGYSADVSHHTNFYAGIRENQPILEDALFGMRAAGPALCSNLSYFEKRIVNWDPEKAKLA